MKNDGFEDEVEKIDIFIVRFFKRHGINFLRYSLAAIFIWFGVLKPLGISPAQELVAHTVYWFDSSWFVSFLGWWEVVIGICLLFRPLIRVGIGLMALQLVGTFLPLILLPDVVFNGNLLFPTLEGQYIIKNLLIIGAGMVIGSHVRDRYLSKKSR